MVFFSQLNIFHDNFLSCVAPHTCNRYTGDTWGYVGGNCNGEYEWIENSSNGNFLKTMFYWKLASEAPLIFEWPPFSNEKEYRKLPLQFPEGWEIEQKWHLFYSKILITWEKIVVKNGQKRDFAPP